MKYFISICAGLFLSHGSAFAGSAVENASIATAEAPSPSTRAIKKILPGAKSSCEAPIVVVYDQGGPLGSDNSVCGGNVNTLTFRNSDPVHVVSVKHDDLAGLEGYACQDLYKNVRRFGPTSYNHTETGPYSFKTGAICVKAQELTQG